MSIRDRVNENSSLFTIVAILVLVGALAYMFAGSIGGGGGGEIPDEQYFWDTQNQQFVARPMSDVAPVKLDSGAEAVKAVVYSCSGCGADTLEIAWLEKYPQKARAQLIKYREQTKGQPLASSSMDPKLMKLEAAKRIRSRDGGKWVPTNSNDGRKIMSILTNACDKGVRIKFCYPGR